MAICSLGRGGAGTPQDSREYWEAFRKKVFRLLVMGYMRLDTKAYAGSEEPDITGELVKSIRLVAERSSSPKWAGQFAVHDDPPLNDGERRGKRRKRIDVEFELTSTRPHPRYCFEAKRLSGKTHRVSAYCGQEGMGEYLAGNYARDSHEAGMLGYVQTDTADVWAKKLASAIEANDAALSVTPDGRWAGVDVIAELDDTYCTKHDRPTVRKPITLYHLLLSFC